MSNRRRTSKLPYIYCEHCWREDYHVPKLANRLRTILTYLTMGIWVVVEPVRCYTCGKVRMRGVKKLFCQQAR